MVMEWGCRLITVATDEDPSMDGDAVNPTPALPHHVTGVPALASQDEIKMMSLGRSFLLSAITVTTGLRAT